MIGIPMQSIGTRDTVFKIRVLISILGAVYPFLEGVFTETIWGGLTSTLDGSTTVRSAIAFCIVANPIF